MRILKTAQKRKLLKNDQKTAQKRKLLKNDQKTAQKRLKKYKSVDIDSSSWKLFVYAYFLSPVKNG